MDLVPEGQLPFRDVSGGWRCRRSPDVLMLADVEAVEVVGGVGVPLARLGFGQALHHLRLQLQGDVARQHRQKQLLL